MGPLRRLQEALTTTDDAQKTDTVELLWEMGPKPELDEWGEQNPYGQELAELAFVCTGVGLGLTDLLRFVSLLFILSERAAARRRCARASRRRPRARARLSDLVLIFLLLGTLCPSYPTQGARC